MQTKIFLATFDHEGESCKGLLPKKGTFDSAGVDVATPYDFVLQPNETHFVNTGLIIRAPRGYCIQVLPRSGLATKRGIMIPNSQALLTEITLDLKTLLRLRLRTLQLKRCHSRRG